MALREIEKHLAMSQAQYLAQGTFWTNKLCYTQHMIWRSYGAMIQ